MPRSENGGVIGARNFSTQRFAIGVYQLKSQFVANINGAWPRSGSLFLAVSHATTPYFSIYPFSSLGFGVRLSTPATLPTGQGNGVAFAPDGTSVVVAHAVSPFVSAYPFSGLGIGTKYSDPSTLPGGGALGVAINPVTKDVAIAHNLTPYCTVYSWSSGFGSKYSDPATLPANIGQSVTFSNNGNEIAVGAAASPFLYVYPWSSGWGTKYSDHASNYTSSVADIRAVKFHPTDTVITVGFNSSGTLGGTKIERAYGFTSGVGFTSTLYDQQSTLPSGDYLGAAGTRGNDVFSLDWHPTGNDIAYGTNGNLPYTRVFSFNTSTGFVAKYADPATDAAGISINGIGFSPNGDYLATAHPTTPFVTAWPWTTGTGFGSKFTNPGTLPTGTGTSIAWVLV